jgi:hypothetical protein
MTAYAEGPIQVEVRGTLDAWPDKLEGDVGWAYVALTGDSFTEAVAVVLTNAANGIRIRSLEWGRP